MEGMFPSDDLQGLPCDFLVNRDGLMLEPRRGQDVVFLRPVERYSGCALERWRGLGDSSKRAFVEMEHTLPFGRITQRSERVCDVSQGPASLADK